MNFNFELLLFYATLIAAAICVLDIIFFAPKRKRAQVGIAEVKQPLIIEYARSFFPILLIVFLLRSFLFEPFRIPTGSLEPTLLMGDFILVNKYHYGIRLPVVHKKIYETASPQRGDIMVFRWPPNPSVDFIKRVIGLPGDRIKYINKELYVNGQKLPQEFLKDSLAEGEDNQEWPVQEKNEDLLGLKHHVFIDNKKFAQDFDDIIVPPGMYFVMGDNRDDSADSRYWGFVPEKNIVGKAVMIWMSFEHGKYGVRWNRIGSFIH